MAAPSHKTIQNLSGIYAINRTLSDSSAPVLKQQGVNYLVRQAVAYSNVDVTLHQYTSTDGAKHLDQLQHSTGGMKNFEDRIMDWEPTEKYNWIWGKVYGKSRYTSLDEVEDQDEFLREGWDGDEVVEGYVESMTDKWSARQVWGFAEVEGERRHVRRILAKKTGENDLRIRMVYDWKSELEN